MPLCKLHLPHTFTKATATKIGDALHDSLVATCAVNPDDHFYLVHWYEDGAANAHPTFLGRRDPTQTFVAEIVLLGGRSATQKEALYADFRRRVAEIGLDPQNSIMFLVENAAIDWSFGPEGSVEKVMASRAKE